MMKSMFSGVSGLKTHQVRMDVIGNNIANVNTVGFKSSRMSFQEIYSQTVRGAGSSSGGVGGTNPQQIGLGVTVGSIDVNHAKGSIQRTDAATDIMVDGNGFFVVSNDVNAQNRFFTRAGNFTLDNLGFLVAPNGFKVLGTDGKPVQINKSETKAATASTKMMLKGNINFNESSYSTTTDVFDSLGKTHTITVNYGPVDAKTTTPVAMDTLDPRYDATAVPAQTSNYSYRRVNFSDGTTTVPADGNLFVKFNENGDAVKMIKLTYNAGPPATYALPETPLTAAPAVSNISINVPGAAAVVIPINDSILYENGDSTSGKRVLSQYAQTTDAKSVSIDGNSSGSLNSYSIAANGEVVGVFTNGEKKTLSTIMLADFDNPAGLIKMGSNLFGETNNSGVPKYGKPGTGSIGSLAPGALEMSNVDLSQEFTDMITTQRGFQANSKIITTTDEMLQELVNLKR